MPRFITRRFFPSRVGTPDVAQTNIEPKRSVNDPNMTKQMKETKYYFKKFGRIGNKTLYERVEYGDNSASRDSISNVAAENDFICICESTLVNGIAKFSDDSESEFEDRSGEGDDESSLFGEFASKVSAHIYSEKAIGQQAAFGDSIKESTMTVENFDNPEKIYRNLVSGNSFDEAQNYKSWNDEEPEDTAFVGDLFITSPEQQRLLNLYRDMISSDWITTFDHAYMSELQILAKVFYGLSVSWTDSPTDHVFDPRPKSDVLTLFLALARYQMEKGYQRFENVLGSQISYQGFLRLYGAPDLAIHPPKKGDTWGHWLMKAKISLLSEHGGYMSSSSLEKAKFYARMDEYMDLLPGMRNTKILTAFELEGDDCCLSYLYRKVLENLGCVKYNDCGYEEWLLTFDL